MPQVTILDGYPERPSLTGNLAAVLTCNGHNTPFGPKSTNNEQGVTSSASGYTSEAETKGSMMGEFIRARSAEQKCQRMDEIKCAAARLFAENPYHEITLTTIAQQLSWSRANLYKYVTTKEDVFLALAEDERDAYYAALAEAFAHSPRLEPAEAARTWTAIMNEHQAWFRLHDLLLTIIETNVTHERLVEFKRGYYEQIGPLCKHISAATGVAEGNMERLMNTLTFHATGLVTNCCSSPRIQAALAELGRTPHAVDFEPEMREFCEMCLEHWQE